MLAACDNDTKTIGREALRGAESSFSGECRTLAGRLRTYESGRDACYDVITIARDLGYSATDNGFDWLPFEPDSEAELRETAIKACRYLAFWCDKWGVDPYTAELEWA